MIRVLLPALILSSLSGAATLSVANGTRGWVFTGVYVRVSGSDGGWGSNLLGEGEIIGLTGLWSTRLAPGIYDIRLEDSDGDGYVKSSVVLEEGFLWKVALSDMNDPASIPGALYDRSG